MGVADRRTLIRRLYLDLIGLPPTFDEVRTFVDDKSPDAVARVVDDLLLAPNMESAGRGIGSMSSVTPKRTVTSATATSRTPGDTATT